MNDLLIQQQELDFLLWTWLDVGTLLGQAGDAAHDRQTINGVLDLSANLAAEAFLPHYKQADQTEPSIGPDGDVHVLPAIGDALRRYAALGLFGAGFDEDLGGLGLPMLVVAASLAQFMAANVATAAYPMLTIANARLIATFGTAAQIDTFARPQIAGHTFGTMCLSEPQAGSGLADIRTRAVQEGEDPLGKRYRLAGNKMWISGGDQDVTRNIVHLVLAKVPDADGTLPAGTKGISLFIVPKWLPDDQRNDIVVAGLNHKMGYRGIANCLLNLGEGRHLPDTRAGAVGWLIGEEGQGLSLMFQMMNEARINVGLGAAAVAYRGFRHALAYARGRTQGRALDARRGDAAPIAIIEHPDVQRMLLAQKAYAEGALALVLFCAKLVDLEKDDAAAAELLALLTPVAKTWPSEWGLVANDLAIQVHGGYGYTRDFDVEQLYRDNRLNSIHEGTTGIQALDLLGRKVLRGDGRALAILLAKMRETAARAAADARLAGFGTHLVAAVEQIETSVATLIGVGVSKALANATAFLSGFGHIVIAWLWLDQALACAGHDDLAYAEGKRRTCRFFFECELPRAHQWLSFAASLSDVAANVPTEQFG